MIKTIGLILELFYDGGIGFWILVQFACLLEQKMQYQIRFGRHLYYDKDVRNHELGHTIH